MPDSKEPAGGERASDAVSSLHAMVRRVFEHATDAMLVVSLDGIVQAANHAGTLLLESSGRPVVGQALCDLAQSLGTRKDVATLRDLVSAAAVAAAGATFTSDMDDSRGGRTRAWTIRCLTAEQDKMAMYVEVRDVTEERRADAERRLLTDLALALTQTDSIELALTVTLRATCELSGWALGEAWIPSVIPPTNEIQLARAVVHTADPALQRFVTRRSGFRLAPGEGLAGLAWQRGDCVWHSPVTVRPGFRRSGVATWGRLRSAVAIPVLARREPMGVLVYYARDARACEAYLVRAASAAAAQLGPMFQQKKVEDALCNATARFSGMVALSMDAIISVDDARRITAFNYGAECVFGYTAEEALGRLLEMLLVEDDRTWCIEEVARFSTSTVASSWMNGRRPIAARRKDGEVFPAEASISRYMMDGRWTFTLILRDVNDRGARDEGY